MSNSDAKRAKTRQALIDKREILTRNGRTYRACPLLWFYILSFPVKVHHKKASRPQMSTPHQIRPTSLLSPQFVNSVYIPSGLLLVGVGFIKPQWLPYAIALSLVLGAWRIYSVGKHSWRPGRAAVVQNLTDNAARLQRLR